MILTRVFNKAQTLTLPCRSMLPTSPRTRSSSLFAAALTGAWLTTALAPALAADPPPARGPTIELAPEHQEPAKKEPLVSLGAGEAPDHELVRGLTEQRFRSAAESLARTSVGGYGEVHVSGLKSGRLGEREWTADVARLVLFVAHPFNDRIRAYTELEIEHAVSCASCPGAVELEQAYLDWKVLGDWLGLRAGLVLVPMGIINQWHEPPVFHGVKRPKVETAVIPSTWREIGLGLFGEPIEGLHYEIYAMTGLDPLGLGAGGLAGARQGGALASANAWAVTARVEVEPLLGVVLGASGYASDAGNNSKYYLRDHRRVDLSVPIYGFTADARFRRAGLEWKILFAEWHLPESEALMSTFDASGQPLFPDTFRPVPTRIRGAYVEGAYDVLHLFGLSHQLLPFARIEFYDTQSAVPQDYAPNPTFSIREYTFGASYRPLQQLVFKGDYQLRNRKLGRDEIQINLGAGFMY
jgi:hypothetical protein